MFTPANVDLLHIIGKPAAAPNAPSPSTDTESKKARPRPPILRRSSLKQGELGNVEEEEDAAEQLKLTEKLISELNEPWEAKLHRTNDLLLQRCFFLFEFFSYGFL